MEVTIMTKTIDSLARVLEVQPQLRHSVRGLPNLGYKGEYELFS